MNKIEPKEDLWGYRKRLLFVCNAIEAAFPDSATSDIRILDVGCGSATQLGLPLARLGYQLTGIDLHEPSINLARELAKYHSNASFVCGSVEDLDAETFNVVVLSEVLEHVSEPEKLLMAAMRYMENDGVVIVTVPNGYGEFEWDSWVFRMFGFERLIEKYEMRQAAKNDARTILSSTENKENHHVQFFSLSRLRRMFQACGLTIFHKNASTFMSGPFIGHTFARFSGFIDWNARISDKLPMVFSSGWFFALKPQLEDKE